jgi:hypothetical protein
MIPDYEMQQLLDRTNPTKRIVRRIDSHTTSIEPRNESCSVCDFCGVSHDGTHGKDYDAEDVEIMVTEALFTNGELKRESQQSKGAWGACIRCAILIDADKRRALFDRAITISMKRELEAFPEIAQLSEYEQRQLRQERNLLIAAAHDAFWRAKK